MTLSIGCGSGLLEALLLHDYPAINIHGVEVSQSLNKYLPEERLQLVRGTWDIAPSARDASVWLFVFPREPGIVQKYVQVYAGSAVTETVVWIGPLADYKEYEGLLDEQVWSRKDWELAGYEAMISWRRRGLRSS